MTLFLTWLHLLAAVIWIGGMMFLSLVLVPVLRRPPLAQHRGLIFPAVARQYRPVAWGALLVLISTGPILASLRGIDLADPSHWPVVLQYKLGLVVSLIGLSAVHDLLIGPRVSQIVRKPVADRTAGEAQLARWAPFFARGNLLLGIAVLYCAVHLARS